MTFLFSNSIHFRYSMGIALFCVLPGSFYTSYLISNFICLIHHVNIMSSDKANLQGSDGRIPAEGDDHQVQPSIIISSRVPSVKDFDLLQRHLANAQQTHNQMQQQSEYNTLVSQWEILNHNNQQLQVRPHPNCIWPSSTAPILSGPYCPTPAMVTPISAAVWFPVPVVSTTPLLQPPEPNLEN